MTFFSIKRAMVFLLTLFLVALPDAQACRESPPQVRYTIFDHEDLLQNKTQGILPYRFYGNGFIADENSLNWQRGRAQNLREWLRYLNIKGLTIHQLDDLIYQGKHLENGYYHNNKTPKPNNKPTVALLNKNKKADALKYLNLIQASNNTMLDKWEEDYKKATVKSTAAQIQSLDNAYKTATNDFLKQRYAYQEVVLAANYSRYDACIVFFEKRLAPFGKKSVIYWWGLDHYATAIAVKGNKPKAMALYAQVFANDDYKKLRMYQAFESKYANQALKYCTNAQEKANVLILAGLQEKGRGLQKLQQVVSFAPENPLINSLLALEINKLEDWILTKKVANSNSITAPQVNEKWNYDSEKYHAEIANWYEINLESDKKYAKTVLTWLESVSNNKRLQQPAFFKLATAYVAFMLNEQHKTIKWAKAVENTPNISQNLQIQARITRLLAEINVTKTVTTSLASSDALLTDLKWLERNRNTKPIYTEDYYSGGNLTTYNSPYGDCMLALASRARAQNNELYEMLLMAKGNTFYGVREWDQVLDAKAYWFTELDWRNDTTIVAALIECAKKPKTPLETYLTTPIRKDINRLYDLLGTIHLRNDRLEQALVSYKKIPASWWTHNRFEVYNYLTEDMFNRFPVKTKPWKYQQNKAMVVEKMLDFRQKSNKNDAKAAFYLANAYYNMTYQGNSWAMMRYWYSININKAQENNLLQDNIPKARVKLVEYTQKNYYTANQAKFYYQKAMDLAEKQKNQKLAALCLRYVAQCENAAARAMDTYYNQGKAFEKLPATLRLSKKYPQYAAQLLSSDCGGWDMFLK
jgi:hypothetical protein